jgi:hypothetical protein
MLVFALFPSSTFPQQRATKAGSPNARIESQKTADATQPTVLGGQVLRSQILGGQILSDHVLGSQVHGGQVLGSGGAIALSSARKSGCRT